MARVKLEFTDVFKKVFLNGKEGNVKCVFVIIEVRGCSNEVCERFSWIIIERWKRL